MFVQADESSRSRLSTNKWRRLEGCQNTWETTAGTWRTADRKKERNYRLQKSTKSMQERLWQQQQLIMERLIKENVIHFELKRTGTTSMLRNIYNGRKTTKSPLECAIRLLCCCSPWCPLVEELRRNNDCHNAFRFCCFLISRCCLISPLSHTTLCFWTAMDVAAAQQQID